MTCTADVIKVIHPKGMGNRMLIFVYFSQIESPKNGDDTRSWLPPSAPVPPEGYPRPDLPPESAYFLQANRNKRS